MPYKKCIDNRAWQDKVLNRIVRVAGYTAAAIGLVAVYQIYNNHMMFKVDLQRFVLKNLTIFTKIQTLFER